LQFIRHHAGDLNLDGDRVGATGESAGACSCLWLAYHDDLADPNSSDPCLHRSTRLSCVAVTQAQTSLDPLQMKEWIPNSAYGGHAFGKQGFAQFLADRDRLLHWINDCSPYALVRPGAPPACLFYRQPPSFGEACEDPTHSANFGVKLQERCHELGVACDVVYPGTKAVRFATPTDYLVAALQASCAGDDILPAIRRPS
jgi:acetyl esterase/lipase